jgi:hypothetical protein
MNGIEKRLTKLEAASVLTVRMPVIFITLVPVERDGSSSIRRIGPVLPAGGRDILHDPDAGMAVWPEVGRPMT